MMDVVKWMASVISALVIVGCWFTVCYLFPEVILAMILMLVILVFTVYLAAVIRSAMS